MEIVMNPTGFTMNKSERVVYELKELYSRYGYSQYKMSKFEEYDLYVRNKSFLLSDNIITFTDTDGKLMALKPDVTLSIVKNSKDRLSGLTKVYYNENVYRIPRGAHSFCEIMQAGLECIGELDVYSVAEVIGLAAKSLACISDDYVLDVSDLSIISSVIDGMGLSDKGRDEVLMLVGEKNLHGIDSVCTRESVDTSAAEVLKKLISLGGECDELCAILENTELGGRADQFVEIVGMLKQRFGRKIRIDFSVVADMRYYNGIVFKGFVKGVPASVLSGGRYDSLMAKMGKSSGAIGFAVYLDAAAELDGDVDEYDTDVFVLYSEKSDVSNLYRLVEEMADSGERVMTGRELPDGIRYRRLINL